MPRQHESYLKNNHLVRGITFLPPGKKVSLAVNAYSTDKKLENIKYLSLITDQPHHFQSSIYIYISVMATANQFSTIADGGVGERRVSNGFPIRSTEYADPGVDATAELIQRNRHFRVELGAGEGAFRRSAAVPPAAPDGRLDRAEAPLPPGGAGGVCVHDQQLHVALHPSLRRPPRKPGARRLLPWQQWHPALGIWPHGKPNPSSDYKDSSLKLSIPIPISFTT